MPKANLPIRGEGAQITTCGLLLYLDIPLNLKSIFEISNINYYDECVTLLGVLYCNTAGQG